MAVRIDGNNDLINAADGTLTVEGISVNITGISTASGGYKVGTAYTVFPNGNVATAGIVSASSFVGNGANLTGITQTTITNNANNRVVTGSDTSNTLIAETGLTYNTQTLLLNNTSANPQFHLTSAANGICEVKFGDANDTTRGNIIYRNGTSGEALCFHGYNNTERMRITSDGGIGIGTTNPYVLNEPAKFNELTIGGKTEGAAITLRDDNGNVKGGLFTSDVTGAMIVRTVTNHDMHFRTNNTDRLILNNDGHLAVGAEPSSGLGLFSVKPISGTDAFFKIRGASDFDANLSGSVIDNRNSANSASKDFIVRSQNLVLWQDATEAVRITDEGKVGIGLTNPESFNAGADDLVIQRNGNAGITIDSTSGSNSNIFFADGPTGNEAYRGYCQYVHSSDTFNFGRAGVDHMQLQNDGGIKNVLGNFIVGTSGRGLQFNASDSGSSEILDDYEFGTFTPTCAVEGQSNFSLSVATGLYVRVGKTVHVWFEIQANGTPSNRTTSNAWEFGGFPFLSQNDTDSSHPGLRDYRYPLIAMNVDTSSTYGSNGHFILRLNDNSQGGRIEWQHSDLTIKNASLFIQDSTMVQFGCTYPTSM